jgi:hypothetical protein
MVVWVLGGGRVVDFEGSKRRCGHVRGENEGSSICCFVYFLADIPQLHATVVAFPF